MADFIVAIFGLAMAIRLKIYPEHRDRLITKKHWEENARTPAARCGVFTGTHGGANGPEGLAKSLAVCPSPNF
jgi:hypothetical protein